MKISCELKEVDNVAESSTNDKRLYIRSDILKSSDILFSEFMGYYERSKRESGLLTYEPSIGINTLDNIVEVKNDISDFTNMMDFLASKLSISENVFDSEDELDIESSFGNFLELPWEKITPKNVCVIRKIPTEKTNFPEQINNLMFIISSSNVSANGEMSDLKDKLKSEILKAIDQVIQSAPKYFKVNNVAIAKHTTKESFGSLPWESYNYIHIIMHGDENGGLCLESMEIDKYKIQDVMNIEEALDVLNDKKFLLSFLSFCYSGGGLIDNKNSLAFHLVNRGISKYAIGYRHGVGEDSALNFSEIFYRILLNGSNSGRNNNKIEEVYKKSLLEYNEKSGLNNRYTPILYTNT